MKKAIPYYRVSTEHQNQSGLGLEAQQKAVHDYASLFDLKLLNEFIEVETGCNDKRPVLQTVLKLCKKENALLLIAKQDRLSRSVAFIAMLLEAKVPFVSVDDPLAEKFMKQIKAVFSEYERDQTSKRTKDALAATKLRGVKLGENGRNVLSKKNRQAADDFALKMKPIIQGIKNEGKTSFRSMTRILNKRKIKPYTGQNAKWHLHSVYSICKRIETLDKRSIEILNTPI